MTHDAAISKAGAIASQVLAPSAAQNDKAGRFSTEAVHSLGESGLLALLLPANFGGSGLGPRTFAAVTATLAEADASVAMVYLMHVLGTACLSAARPAQPRHSRPYCRRLARAATYPLSASVKPARAVISGPRYLARSGTGTGFESAPRNRG